MHIKQFYLSMKNLGFYYFVPIIFLFIVMPYLSIAEIKEYGIDNAYLGIAVKLEMYIPLLQSWWIVFSMKEYIEGDGNEILYTYEKNKLAKSSYIMAICLYYILHVGVLYFAYSFVFEDMLVEYAKTVIQCMFFASSTYMLIYLLKSTTFPLMIVFIYNIFMIFTQEGLLKILCIYTQGYRMNLFIFKEKFILVLIASFVFLVVGIIMNKRFYR